MSEQKEKGRGAVSPFMLFTVDVASAGLAAWDSSGLLPYGLLPLVLLSLSLSLSLFHTQLH